MNGFQKGKCCVLWSLVQPKEKESLPAYIKEIVAQSWEYVAKRWVKAKKKSSQKKWSPPSQPVSQPAIQAAHRGLFFFLLFLLARNSVQHSEWKLEMVNTPSDLTFSLGRFLQWHSSLLMNGASQSSFILTVGQCRPVQNLAIQHTCNNIR